jgi:hypothetical protein
VFGNPTSQGTAPPPAAPFSLWGAVPQPKDPFGSIDLFKPPAWAEGPLGPGATSATSGPALLPSVPQGTQALGLAADALF